MELFPRRLDLPDVLAYLFLLRLRQREDLLDLFGILCDDAADLLRRRCRLLGELSDLLSDDGKTLALLAGARRLDGGIEGEKFRLPRDIRDEFVNLRDILRAGIELLDGRARLHRTVRESLDTRDGLIEHRVAFLRRLSRRRDRLTGFRNRLRDRLHLLVDVHEHLRRLLNDSTLCSALLGDVRDSLSRDLRDLRRLSGVQRKLLARLRHLTRRLARRTDRAFQSFEHRAAARLQGADLIAAHVRGKLHRQVACCNLFHQRGQEPERRDRRSQQDVGDAQDERERNDADNEQRHLHLCDGSVRLGARQSHESRPARLADRHTRVELRIALVLCLKLCRSP